MGPGETCRWHVARQSSLENLFFKDEVAGLHDAGRVPVAPPKKKRFTDLFFFETSGVQTCLSFVRISVRKAI